MAHPTEKQRPDAHRQPETPEPPPEQPRVLTPEAKRALAEAEERRRLAEAARAANPPRKEIGGRDGPDPTRYGDWEKNGIASDF
jgi:hypothetical protein